jgi:hypothetical protein
MESSTDLRAPQATKPLPGWPPAKRNLSLRVAGANNVWRAHAGMAAM